MIHVLVVTFSLALIGVIMLLRANDSKHKQGVHWIARKIAFAVIGGMCLGLVLYHWQAYAVNGLTHRSLWYSFFEGAFYIGLDVLFVTTPNQEPFWKWLTKGSDEHVE